MDEYLKRSQVFYRRLILQPGGHKQARWLFFRMVCPIMQANFHRHIDLTHTPRVFVHGNPHLDNYVRTFRGAALLDFDRSRIGPYSWDLVRFLTSLALRRSAGKGFLDRTVIEHVIDGYITHFQNPEIPFKQVKLLKSVEPQKWQTNTTAYLESNKRWAKKMRQFPLSVNKSEVVQLLKAYLESRHELGLLEEYRIQEVGGTPGTLGKKHYIYSLAPKNPDSMLDHLLLDIKEVYSERDTQWFKNPYPHHGQRMIEASKLYADGMEQRLGFATIDNRQYWGRQVPTFAVKVKKFLDVEEQCDVGYSIASQLGKGHRKYLKDAKDVAALERDFLLNFDRYVKIARLCAYEISLAYEYLIRKQRLYTEYKTW